MSGRPSHFAAIRGLALVPSMVAVLALQTLGCATNPVTGRSEVRLISESQEISMGTANYAPTRQTQGGDFKLDPELNAYVSEVGLKLARASARPNLPYEFSIINDSVPNAWALPGGKIAINRGLLSQLESEAQLAAVLGHEIIHAAARHGAKSVERAILLQTAVVAAGTATTATGHEMYTGLATLGGQVGAALIQQKYGRGAELESDLYGMRMMQRAGYDPRAAIELQEIFLRLSKGRQSSWLEGLFASHPPSQERIDANRATAEELLAGAASPGELHVERYAKKTALLRRTADAYASYDRGVKALATGDTAAALVSAVEALDTEPREARFHQLRGDLRLAQKRPRDAIVNYDRAIELDTEFFHSYLQRGLARGEIGDEAGARADLERSIELLPTAVAHEKLGDLAAKSGNTTLAMHHFREASGSPTPEGQAALQQLTVLELPSKPQAYVAVKANVDSRGYVNLRIENRSVIAVEQVSIAIIRLDPAGRVLKTQHVQLPGELAPQSQTARQLNISVASMDEFHSMRFQVVSARPSQH